MSCQITKIERQKKNRQRYSIFVDDAYLFSVAEEVLTSKDLRAGRLLSENEIEAIKWEDERIRCRLQAFRFLARRDHSEKELSDKLKQKGFAEKTIHAQLEDLKRLRFLNDENFALLFARNRMIQHPVGKRQLAFELKRKGISPVIADSTIEKIYDEFDEMELAKNLAGKKMKSMKNLPPLKKKKRLSDFLARRGFDWDLIQQLFSELNELKDAVN